MEAHGERQWEPGYVKSSGLQGRRRLLRAFRAGLQDMHALKVYTMGSPAGSFQGSLCSCHSGAFPICDGEPLCKHPLLGKE